MINERKWLGDAEPLTYYHHPCLQFQPQSQVLVEILVSASHLVVAINEVFTAPGWPTCTRDIMYIQTHGVTYTMREESGTETRKYNFSGECLSRLHRSLGGGGLCVSVKT